MKKSDKFSFFRYSSDGYGPLLVPSPSDKDSPRKRKKAERAYKRKVWLNSICLTPAMLQARIQVKKIMRKVKKNLVASATELF